MPLLEAFVRIANAGDFGKIDSFRGMGRARDGNNYAFSWQNGGELVITPIAKLSRPGEVILTGLLDYQTINRIRNFPLFHLRGDADNFVRDPAMPEDEL